MHDSPNQCPDISCMYTLKQLKEGVYLKLYYLEYEGLDAVKTMAGQALNEGLQPIIDPIMGRSTWIAASAKRDTNSFKQDDDLTWDKFVGAVPRMLLAMQHARWPPEHISLMAKFWGNILSHNLRLSMSPLMRGLYCSTKHSSVEIGTMQSRPEKPGTSPPSATSS
ncbi:hypothetical protein M422DRAFT_270092 [Sphaerobolus stellatus SS14]|uniref:Uncharacterized protein n=1 Tax=Sphaerobolus stellatus (strain SS14) TaxID=990650 RepID=A0A0C9U308_SPHS4|nr:hypothetical protein M422DRAFT_270092 [Sphaerobolus stellatus SS14]